MLKPLSLFSDTYTPLLQQMNKECVDFSQKRQCSVTVTHRKNMDVIQAVVYPRGGCSENVVVQEETHLSDHLGLDSQTENVKS